jgi:hypothetical protein
MKTLLALALTLIATSFANAQSSTVFATVPSPGFPENGHHRGGKIYVGVPGTPRPNPGGPPSQVLTYDRDTGTLLNTQTITVENTANNHGLLGIVSDAAKRLYIASVQGFIIRFDPMTSAQSIYSSFPDLPTCALAPPPCSPTLADLPMIPNDMVFTSDGAMYVTDNFQATIWKVPAGGGTPSIWYQDARFDGVSGLNGMRLDVDGTHFVFVGPAQGFVGGGVVRRLPIVVTPTATDLTDVHSYLESLDGLAVGETGKLYVCLNLANQVSVLDPSGTELTRYVGPAVGGPLGLMPFDTPTSLTFVHRRRSLLMTNNSVAGNPLNWALIEIAVNDGGAPILHPTVP